MLRLLLRALGATMVEMTREEAAAWILQREIRVVHRPLIVEVERDEHQ